MKQHIQRPTGAFVGASWLALLIGGGTFLFGLWNSSLQLNEKGFYFTVLMYGLFSAVSLQKSVRDRMEEIPVTGIYFGLCWVSLGLAVLLLFVGLYNIQMTDSEKGFFAALDFADSHATMGSSALYTRKSSGRWFMVMRNFAAVYSSIPL